MKKSPIFFDFFYICDYNPLGSLIYFLHAPMKNHSKEFRDILDSGNIQEKLRNIKDDTGKNLCSVLKISNEDIEELRKIINKNKMNA